MFVRLVKKMTSLWHENFLFYCFITRVRARCSYVDEKSIMTTGRKTQGSNVKETPPGIFYMIYLKKKITVTNASLVHVTTLHMVHVVHCVRLGIVYITLVVKCCFMPT